MTCRRETRTRRAIEAGPKLEIRARADTMTKRALTKTERTRGVRMDRSEHAEKKQEHPKPVKRDRPSGGSVGFAGADTRDRWRRSVRAEGTKSDEKQEKEKREKTTVDGNARRKGSRGGRKGGGRERVYRLP